MVEAPSQGGFPGGSPSNTTSQCNRLFASSCIPLSICVAPDSPCEQHRGHLRSALHRQRSLSFTLQSNADADGDGIISKQSPGTISLRESIRSCSLWIRMWNPNKIKALRRTFVAGSPGKAPPFIGQHVRNFWITFGNGQIEFAGTSCRLASAPFTYVSARVQTLLECMLHAGPK